MKKNQHIVWPIQISKFVFTPSSFHAVILFLVFCKTTKIESKFENQTR